MATRGILASTSVALLILSVARSCAESRGRLEDTVSLDWLGVIRRGWLRISWTW